jgi:hypothetical protein
MNRKSPGAYDQITLSIRIHCASSEWPVVNARVSATGRWAAGLGLQLDIISVAGCCGQESKVLTESIFYGYFQ